MTTGSDEELNDEERRQAILIFKALPWVVQLIMFAAIAVQIYAGMQGWLWYAAIPLWALLWFVLKAANQTFRNISDALEAEITVKGAKPFE